MERLVATHDHLGATREVSFSLWRYDMERRGRTKAFVTTGLVAFALFWLQTLPWLVSTGHLNPHQTMEAIAVPAPIAPRLSLLFDFLFLVALAYHGVRCHELASMGQRMARLEGMKPNFKRWKLWRRAGLVILMLGIGLDAVENVLLWTVSAEDHTQDFFIPGLTPAVWTGLTVGVLLLWSATGWAWWNIKHHKDPHGNLAVKKKALPKLDGTIITCSGGGIRSTSFCLGGLQVLSREGIYQKARSVIGVSGGGYIAAAMHILRTKSNLQPGDPPFADASPEEAWLRRNTRYLLESVKVAALGGLSLLYGMLVNLFLVASVMAFIAWWSGWFYLVSGGLTDWNTPQASALNYNQAWTAVTWTVWLAPAGLAVFMIEDAADRLFKVPRFLRVGSRELSVLLLALGIGSLLFFYAVPSLLVTAHNYAAGSSSPWSRLITAAGLIPQGVCTELLAQKQDACGAAAGPSVAGASLVSLGAIVAAAVTVLRSARRFLPDAATAPRDSGRLRRLQKWLCACSHGRRSS